MLKYHKKLKYLGNNMSDNLLIYGGILVILLVILISTHFIKKHLYLKTLKSPIRFSEQVKNGYLELKNLLLYKSDKNALEKTIRNIAIYKTDGRYVGGYTKKTIEFDSKSFVLDYFYEVLNYLDSKNETFILSFSNRLTRKEFENKLKLSLGDLSHHIQFPLEHLSLEGNVILEKEALLEYQKILEKHNIQMAFVNDMSDSYNIILHNIKREKEVSKAISLIGLEYHNDLSYLEIED